MRSWAAGESSGEPQAAVGGEALLGGEVVGVDLRRGRRAGRRRRRWRRPGGGRRRRRPPGGCGVEHHAGRGLVVGVAVGVDPGGGRRTRGGCPVALVMTSVVAEVGRGLAGRGELGRELAEGQVLAAVARPGRRWRRPRRRWTRRCRGRPRSRRAARTARRGRARRRPTTSFTGFWRWLVPIHDPATSARDGHGLGPDLGRAAAEAAVGREEVGGDLEWRGCRTARASMAPMARISARVAAVAESATLAIDAKAKALKAAGEPVIGFGAGEPDFPRPTPSSRPPSPPAATRRTTATRRPAGLPELREAIAEKTRARHRLRRDGGPGAGHQRRQAGGRGGVRHHHRPGRRGARPGALLDHLPRGHRPGRRRAGRAAHHEATGFKVTVDQLEAACTARTKVLLFVSPSNPTGAVYSEAEIAAIGRVGRGARACGSSPTRSTSTSSTATPRHALDAGRRARAGRPHASWSTAWPRPTP